ncbi:MAG: sigma 54-interacting transcriptional regulator, partial [Opitutales bacterium]|nr:sigma 54-interacting transcriptional regulator [Opitutales bacterium]
MKKIEHTKESTEIYPSEEIEIALLEKISSMVAKRQKVSDIISTTLSELSQKLGFIRTTITLRNGDYLFIEDAYGLDKESIKRGVYKIGEGITGKVVDEAKSIVIHDISKCKDFLNRTKSHAEPIQNTSFLCVPIDYMEQIIGTISAERLFADKKRLNADLEILETISNVIADSIALVYMRKEECNKLIAENRRSYITVETNRPTCMIGNCGAMQNVYDFIAKVSKSNDIVFIRGRSGTGKELVASSISEKSKFSEFSVVNCAAVPNSAIAALSFFGLEKEQTIFFDEVTSLSPQIQKSLATALSSGKFIRLGDSKPVAISARIICASSVDVEDLMQTNKFDANLYSLISKKSIHIPSLKDRKSDIVLLAEHFLEKFNVIHSKNIKRISTPAINMMSIYSWPGNVRELENCIERAVMSSRDSAISGYNLPASIRSSYTRRTLPYGEDIDFNSMVESFERELITEALKISRGNAAKAARHLGITQRIINYKIKRYGIAAAWYK